MTGIGVGIGIGPFSGGAVDPRLILGSKLVAWYRSDLGVTLQKIGMSQPIDFSHADWSKSLATVDSGGNSDPDGGTNAYEVTATFDAADTFHYIFDGVQNARNAPVKLTVYAKAVTGADWLCVQCGATTACWFNISSGTVGTTNGTTSTSITDAGASWWKIEVEWSARTPTNLDLLMCTADNDQTFVAAGTEKVLLYNAVFEATDGGGLVSAHADQSGNGWHLTQGTAANQPVWVASGGPNGWPYIEFDGSNDALRNTSLSVDQPNMMWGIVLPSVSDRSTVQTLWDSGGGNTRRLYTDSGIRFLGYAGAALPTLGLGTLDNFHKIRVLYNDTSGEIRVDADAEVTGAIGSSAGTDLIVGAYGSVIQHSDSRFCEIILTNADCTAAEQAAIEAYLDARYGAL